MSARLSAAELTRRCDEWNTRFPIGTAVSVRMEFRTFETRTRSRAQVLGNNTAGVWLAGLFGCFALDRVSPVAAEHRA